MFIQGNIVYRPRGKEGIWFLRGGILGQVSQKETLRWYCACMSFIKGMLQGKTGEGVWAAERGQAKLWFHAQSQPGPWGSSGMLSDTLGLALTWGKTAEFSDSHPSWSLVLRRFWLSKSEGRADPTTWGRPLQKVAGMIHQRSTQKLAEGLQKWWRGSKGSGWDTKGGVVE